MSPALLFDVHVHHGATERLWEEGIDVVHASDVGLGDPDDLSLLLSAVEAGRIVVARNYQDFIARARISIERGKFIPGVLFLSPRFLNRTCRPM